jgi:hypothetical protein
VQIAFTFRHHQVNRTQDDACKDVKMVPAINTPAAAHTSSKLLLLGMQQVFNEPLFDQAPLQQCCIAPHDEHAVGITKGPPGTCIGCSCIAPTHTVSSEATVRKTTPQAAETAAAHASTTM